MNVRDEPLVTILTPVYNGEEYLAGCIESVLAQNYQNFEYIIVNNCSTDRSLEIALDFEKRDARIKVHRNEEFVGVIANHNIAFRLMSPAAKYCKVVSADDAIFPDCVSRLVGLAQENPSVGLVGCYQISGSVIRWQGFEYPKNLFSGRELCRRIFLKGDPEFGFGTPTSLLYRADLVRKAEEFYPNPSPHSDTSACFNILRETDFGFVHEILSYEKTHVATQSTRSAQMNRYAPASLNDLIQYGRVYLSEKEYADKLKRELDRYYRYLAVSLLEFKSKEFWNYHRSQLADLGFPLKSSTLAQAFVRTMLQEAVNPGQAVRKTKDLLMRRSNLVLGWGASVSSLWLLDAASFGVS